MTGVIPEAVNLPAPFTSFVGRRREVVEIGRFLGTARLLTLTGVGGIGKTRLALEAAAASAMSFPDGVWLGDLTPVRDLAGAAAVVSTTVGMPDLGTRPDLYRLAGYLAGRRAMIVLDNCEHLVDACAELAAVLLSAAPELRILATSRQTLGIVGEHVLTVAPLPLEESVELLRDRAAALRPEFRITETNRAVVSRLCADLDGLPLAIELAASRLRVLSVDQVAARLENRFALLTGGNRTARPRQRTLRATVDWSYELCSPAERLLWNRLSVFADSFALDAAEGVCAGDGIAPEEVLDLLDRLITQSVVLPNEAEDQPRYRMLETIRQYGRERLAESGEEARLLRRHRDSFLVLAERLADGWFGPGQQEGLLRLRAEHGNLLVALDCGGDPQAGLALAAALRFHWCVDGYLGEGRRVLDRVIAAAPEPTPARARALWVAAWVAVLQGDLAAAHQWLDEADELGERLDDPVVRAYVQTLRGSSALFREQMEEAMSWFEGAVAAHTALGERTGTVFTLFQLCVAHTALEDPRAVETGRRAIALAEAHGEQWGRAHALWALAHATGARGGDSEEVMALTRASLEAQQGFNEYVATALTLQVLVWTVLSGGDHERAGRLLGALRALLRNLGTTLEALGPYWAEQQARYEEAVARALGRDAYERALKEGASHDTPARAIAYALETGTDQTATGPASAPGAAMGSLTVRERQVAALVAQGMSNRQIAAELVLSPRTVDSHIENIRAKLGFGRRTQIAAWWAANQPRSGNP